MQQTAVRGHNVTKKTADAITDALGLPFKDLFEPVDPDKTLSGTTIHRYHELLSSIFNTAVRWQVIFSNPCERVQPPKKNKPDPKYLDEVQARELLTLLKTNRHSFGSWSPPSCSPACAIQTPRCRLPTVYR